MKILFSGISSVTAAATIICLVSFVLGARLHSMTGRWLQAVRNRCWESFKEPRTLLPYTRTAHSRRCSFHWLFPTVAITISLLFLQLTRPAIPYNHLSGAIPLTMLNAFHKESEGCRPQPLPFPLRNQDGSYRSGLDWGLGRISSMAEDPLERPYWLPEDSPPGFDRWEVGVNLHEEKFGIQPARCQPEPYQYFNASKDPLRVSNFDENVVASVRDAMKGVDIQHIVLVTLESGRKELFPTQPGTPLYDYIIDSNAEEDKEDVKDLLAEMTPVAQMLTGEYVLDSQGERANLSDSPWQDNAAPGMGGINVKGGLTGSTLTLKSFLNSHCGVLPLPVDFMEEALLDIYQPCLPQILELFNRKKTSGNETRGKPFLGQRWQSAFMEAATDTYDRQNIADDHMGFEYSVSKEKLEDENSLYYPPMEDEVNYFG